MKKYSKLTPKLKPNTGKNLDFHNGFLIVKPLLGIIDFPYGPKLVKTMMFYLRGDNNYHGFYQFTIMRNL
jgi:hypothetical protein